MGAFAHLFEDTKAGHFHNIAQFEQIVSLVHSTLCRPMKILEALSKPFRKRHVRDMLEQIEGFHLEAPMLVFCAAFAASTVT